MKTFRATFAALATFCSTAAYAAAPKVTRADFAAMFERDPIEAIALSPDGVHLAYVAREKGASALYVVDVFDPSKRKTLRVTGNRYLAWTNTGLLIYGPPKELRAINADGTGDRKVVDDRDIQMLDIDPYPPTKFELASHTSKPYPRVPELISVVPTHPEDLIVRGSARVPSHRGFNISALAYYVVNARTGERKQLEYWNQDGHALFDQGGKVRMYAKPTSVSLAGITDLTPDEFRIEGSWSEWVDFDLVVGQPAGVTFTSPVENFFGERSLPLGFGPDPNVLYFASNVGRDTYGIYALDMAARKRTSFAVEDPVYDLAAPDDTFTNRPLVFERNGKLAGFRKPDRPTEWLLPELSQMQQRLEAMFRNRTIRILDWNDDHTRAVFTATTASDPGRYFVYDAPTRRAAEFLRRSGDLDLDKMGEAAAFAFDTPTGVHLTGTLTQPRNPVINPPPLVVYCRDFPSTAPPDGFNADAQALAAMGFIVVEVNHRGMLGFGQRHFNALKEGLDRIPLEDIRATIEWVASRQKIDRTRIAIVGEGLGGFLAVRALELFPEEFRCAVCMNAPVSPADWVYGAGPGSGFTIASARQRLLLKQIGDLTGYSATSNASAITKPVLIMQEPNKAELSPEQGQALRRAIRAGQGDVAYEDLTRGFSTRDPGARAAAYLQIADFMRAALYDYNVKVGPVRAVK